MVNKALQKISEDEKLRALADSRGKFLFDQYYRTKNAHDEGYNEGYDKGYDKGYDRGKLIGMIEIMKDSNPGITAEETLSILRSKPGYDDLSINEIEVCLYGNN